MQSMECNPLLINILLSRYITLTAGDNITDFSFEESRQKDILRVLA